MSEIIDGTPWYEAKELAGKPGMPETPQGVNFWGKDQPRKSRKALGLPGKGWMYPESCLPSKAARACRRPQAKPGKSATVPFVVYWLARLLRPVIVEALRQEQQP